MHHTTLHSRFNRIMALVVAAIAILLVATAASNGAGSAWMYPAAGLALLWAWTALWRPGIRIDDDGVDIVNVTHTAHVPWEALIGVTTKYALTLVTPRGRVAAWSAPAPGALRAAVAGRRPDNRELRATGGAPRPGDLAGTESGDAALLIREEWERRSEAGLIELGVADETAVTRRPHVLELPGMVLLAILAVVALIAGW